MSGKEAKNAIFWTIPSVRTYVRPSVRTVRRILAQKIADTTALSRKQNDLSDALWGAQDRRREGGAQGVVKMESIMGICLKIGQIWG